MDFDSPDVMKDFPGLYASELNKKCNNDSDYSDEADKKKDMLMGKRKEKKDKKDKDKGYAALEGESSGDDDCKSRSPSKSKKGKSFKFSSSKSKEKREKSREKEKEGDKRKERDKKSEKKTEKDKGKKVKQAGNDDIAEVLPIFGVSLELAVERSRCHDGVDIPLPIRACLDYIEGSGTNFEGIYKISGTKSKVLQIRKMYNSRQKVNLLDYDVPTATSLLKMFLRDLPEPIFTNDLLIRFEEAGAILNLNTREKHLKILVDNLPNLNKLLLGWLIIHLHNISLHSNQNKMTKQNISAALNHTFHSSSRLLHALLHHRDSLFPDLEITPYIPPLSSGQQLPEELQAMEKELEKQESLLSQIHTEMNDCVSKEREELLWEVQRIITQLKRSIKIAYKEKEPLEPEPVQDDVQPVQKVVEEVVEEHVVDEPDSTAPEPEDEPPVTEPAPQEPIVPEAEPKKPEPISDSTIMLLKLKNNGLLNLKENLKRSILEERQEIAQLKTQIVPDVVAAVPANDRIDEIMSLLQKENQILQIKKINLVRNIIEQQEICIDLRAKLELASRL